MAEEEQSQVQQQRLDAQQSSNSEDMIACLNALEAALLPCLPSIDHKEPVPDFEAHLADFDESMTELLEPPTMEPEKIADRPLLPHQTDVEKHAKAFMEAAKKLQRYFICLQHAEDKPTKAETLRKEIAAMEEESKLKDELIQKQENRIQDWKNEFKDQLDKHKAELERV
ncbi:hypothetical protein Pint_23821 [Pistacia integerrima]|uniref:Uncharacterized protein n=1 Tax=Pistacia integerrima TaxID=434235 RepID=A0ACC0YKP5_9ROSI|nr:hypothetical protein Pint_23821 [Pistacia integerrima]